MRLKAKLTEMKKADVEYVSLVKRAANRIPFRITKHDKDTQESGMIDLTKVGKIFKGDVAVENPSVAAVVVMDVPEDEMLAITEALKERGMATDKVTKHEDGSVVFAQVDGDITKGTHLVRVSDNMAVVLKGFDQFAETLTQESEFSQAVQQEGFYHDVGVACDAFREHTMKSMYEAEAPADAAKAIKSAGEKFLRYLDAMASGVPTEVLKADATVSINLKQARIKKAEQPEGGDPKAEGKDEVKDEPKDESEVKKDEDPKADDQPVKDPEDKAVKDEGKEPEPDKVAETINALKSELGEMLKAAIGTLQQDLTNRVDEIARKSEDASKAAEEAVKTVKSVVAAGAAPGDTPPKDKSKKADGYVEQPYWDTAMSPRK